MPLCMYKPMVPRLVTILTRSTPEASDYIHKTDASVLNH